MRTVPDRDVILAELRKLPPGARGPSAAELAATVGRATGQRARTTNEMREQLFQLEREGLVQGRIIKRGGAWRWVAEPDRGASHRHPPRQGRQETTDA